MSIGYALDNGFIATSHLRVYNVWNNRSYYYQDLDDIPEKVLDLQIESIQPESSIALCVEVYSVKDIDFIR